MTIPIRTPDDVAIKRTINEMNIKRFTQFTSVILIIFAFIFLLACLPYTSYNTTVRLPASCNPSISTALNQTADTCASPAFNLSNSPFFNIDITDLTSSKQFASFKLMPFRKDTTIKSTVEAQVDVTVYTIEDNNATAEYMPTESKQISFDCSNAKFTDCGNEPVLVLQGVRSQHYYVVLKFTNSQDLISKIDHFAVTMTTLDMPIFWGKILFILAAGAGFYFYTIRMKDFKKDFYCEEEKLLQFIFPLLIAIDEPFTFYVLGNTLYSWIKIPVFIAFSALLLQYWFKKAQRLSGPDVLIMKYTSHDQAIKIYLVVYAAVAWLTYMALHNSIYNDPTASYSSSSGFFVNLFSLILFVIVMAGVAWMARGVFLVMKKSNIIYEKEGYFYLFSVMFFMVHAYLAVRGGLDPLSYDFKKLILFCGTSTLYVLSMAYLFVPSKEGVGQANYLKKYANPAAKDSYKELDESSESPPINVGGINLEDKKAGQKGAEASP